MTNTLTVATAAIRRRFHSILDDKLKMEIVELLFFLQNDIRLNQLASESQILDVWESVRDKESNVDFLHGVSQELHYHLGSALWDAEIQQLAAAYSVNYERSLELTAPVGDDVLERMGGRPFLESQLTLYPWLVVMYLVDLLDLDLALGGIRPDGEPDA